MLSVNDGNTVQTRLRGPKGSEIITFEHIKNPWKSVVGIADTGGKYPALGGTRMFQWPDVQSAINTIEGLDVAMAHKNILAGLPNEGGKAGIIGDPLKDKTPELLRWFAEDCINSLEGRIYTAMDAGVNPEDLLVMAEYSKYIASLPPPRGSGDSAPITAFGVLCAMKAALKFCYGGETFNDREIVVYGVGKVGASLVKLLKEDSPAVKIAIADLYAATAKKVAEKYDCKIIDADSAFEHECTIFSPCCTAPGIINKTTIQLLNCEMVIGATNNITQNPSADAWMMDMKDITYLPDCLVNSGGAINIAAELRKGGYSEKYAKQQTAKIYDRTYKVLQESLDEDRPPAIICRRRIEKVIAERKKVKKA